MAKKNVSVKIDPDEWSRFEQNTKSNGVSPHEELREHVEEYNRTRGYDVEELRWLKIFEQAKARLAEIKKMRVDFREFFPDKLVKEIDGSALAKTNEYGGKISHTEKSIFFWVEKLSKKYNLKPASVRICMRQRIYELYKDDLVELKRLVDILQDMDEDSAASAKLEARS